MTRLAVAVFAAFMVIGVFFIITVANVDPHRYHPPIRHTYVSYATGHIIPME